MRIDIKWLSLGLLLGILLALQSAVANAPWNGVLEEVRVNPRINIVHVDTSQSDTRYYFLAAVPMTVFHYDGEAYASLVIPDDLDDETSTYFLDDWKTYLDQHGTFERHANFIGGVSFSIQEQIRTQFGITDDQDVDEINGTPIEVADKIAEKDWRQSEWVVIAPYKTSLTDQDIESISNSAVLASLLNGPVLFSEVSGLSSSTLDAIASIGADKAILVEIGDVMSQSINNQLTSAGVSVMEDLVTESQVVESIINKSGRSTLCGIVNAWQDLPAALLGARYGGYVLFLPGDINKMAKELRDRIVSDPELNSTHKREQPITDKGWVKLSEDEIAQNFYDWLTTVGGNDPDSLETVITFEPQGTGGGDLETTFERAISGDPSDLDRPGAISGRMPLEWKGNIVLANRTGMYRAVVFANPRPRHVTLCMNAYEVRHAVDTGSPVPDSWGSNHIINEMFGWPYRGWCAENNYFPWDDLHSNAPDLSPILPPGDGDGADHDPGQFASFLSRDYEMHFHSGAYAGSGSHPAQPDVSNIGFVADVNGGSAFLYFSCHGGGTSIDVRNTDNGMAQDGGAPGWGEPYWPDDDHRVYDGSAGGNYSQTQLDNDLENAHGMMIAYNACGMANGYMNEILLEHGGSVSIGSYASVSFTGSGWWWNIFVHLTTHEAYTTGEATVYATARVSDLTVPPAKAQDTSLRYVLYGDPNCPFVQDDWTSPAPAPIKADYGGHKPDKPAHEFTGTVEPDTIVITAPTAVTVTLLDSVGVGVDSVVVKIEAWGINKEDTTDSSGEVEFQISAPYGEILLVTGKKADFDTFIDTIYVIGGTDFTYADVSAWVTEIGLVDTLTPYYEGTLHAETDQTGFTLYAEGCGIDTSTATSGDQADLLVTPLSPGVIHTAIGKSGSNIYVEGIPVITVYGTLSGAVVNEVTLDSIAAVRIEGYEAGADTSTSDFVFEVVTGSSGVYAVPFELPVGQYDLYVKEFGYLSFSATAMVMYGSSIYDVYLTPSPSGVIWGYVKEEGSSSSLAANISVYRSDNMELQTQTSTDSLTGNYSTTLLPYFNYKIKVTAHQHISVIKDVTVEQDSVEENFYLHTTHGNFLVVDATEPSKETNSQSQGFREPKESPQMDKADGKSPSILVSDLVELGYNVVLDTAATTDPSSWPSYDFLVFSVGDNIDDISTTMKDALVEYVSQSDHKLLMEGGEIGYDNRDGSDFQREVLNIGSTWYGDEEGDISVHDDVHPLTTIPNILPSLIQFDYDGGYGSSDALEPDADAGFVIIWTEDMSYPGVIYREDQIVFYTFDYADIANPEDGIALLENTIEYLVPRLGYLIGSVRDIENSEPIEGANVTTNGEICTTDSIGCYLMRLRPGTYEVTATAPGYNPSTATDIEVTQSDTFTLDFSLTHPEISIIPDAFSVQLLEGSYLDTAMVIYNPGNGPLIFDITTSPPFPDWLSVNPLSDTVEAEQNISVELTFDGTDTSLVLDSTYYAQLVIDNNSVDNPMVVPVNMTVLKVSPFIRGDLDGNMEISMDDAIFIFRYIYIPGSSEPTCMDAADVNDSGGIAMSDALYILRYLYVPQSPQPPLPYPSCGSDPTADGLLCDYHPCGKHKPTRHRDIESGLPKAIRTTD